MAWGHFNEGLWKAGNTRMSSPGKPPPRYPESMSAAEPAIALDGVHVVRQGKTLLDDVAWRVDDGEHWAMLGPNGAGKSTLLSLAGAVNFPTSGTVRILGETMGAVEIRRLRERIGHVNPRHPVRSSMTARDVVLAGLTGTTERMTRWEPSPAESARADELLIEFGLDGALRWPTMSQGERGRALIARALIADPELVLFDEPTTGLDVAAREQFLTSMDALPMTTVTVTHHLEELPKTTTHALLIAGGRVLAAGPADEVLTSANVSACFDYPLTVTRDDGRWVARSAG